MPCCMMQQHSRSCKRSQHAQNSFLNSENATAQRRKKWIDFVLATRKNWKPGKTSPLCMMHVKEDDFPFRLDPKTKRLLKTDEIGICVFP